MHSVEGGIATSEALSGLIKRILRVRVGCSSAEVRGSPHSGLAAIEFLAALVCAALSVLVW